MLKTWRSLTKHLDVTAILVASIGAIVLHHLHILPESHVISLILFLLAIHALQEVTRGEEIRGDIKLISQNVAVPDPEIEIIKPADLLLYTEKFALKNLGEDWWFNPCANMFRSDEIFNKLLRPSIENSRTSKILFLMRPEMRETWEREVQPKIERCKGKEKVKPPIWVDIKEGIAFRIIDIGTGKEAREALLTFWGEPFMMEFVEQEERAHMPRYVIHAKNHSELIPRLEEIFTRHRLKTVVPTSGGTALRHQDGVKDGVRS